MNGEFIGHLCSAGIVDALTVSWILGNFGIFIVACYLFEESRSGD